IFLGTVAVGEIKPGFSLSTQQWAIEEVLPQLPSLQITVFAPVTPGVGNKLISPTRKHHKDFVERAEIEKERMTAMEVWVTETEIAMKGIMRCLFLSVEVPSGAGGEHIALDPPLASTSCEPSVMLGISNKDKDGDKSEKMGSKDLADYQCDDTSAGGYHNEGVGEGLTQTLVVTHTDELSTIKPQGEVTGINEDQQRCNLKGSEVVACLRRLTILEGFEPVTSQSPVWPDTANSIDAEFSFSLGEDIDSEESLKCAAAQATTEQQEK
ncbi:hypothetical protein KUCAC02_014750, partial [Chaenocephalus aceratus]